MDEGRAKTVEREVGSWPFVGPIGSGPGYGFLALDAYIPTFCTADPGVRQIHPDRSRRGRIIHG